MERINRVKAVADTQLGTCSFSSSSLRILGLTGHLALALQRAEAHISKLAAQAAEEVAQLDGEWQFEPPYPRVNPPRGREGGDASQLLANPSVLAENDGDERMYVVWASTRKSDDTTWTAGHSTQVKLQNLLASATALAWTTPPPLGFPRIESSSSRRSRSHRSTSIRRNGSFTIRPSSSRQIKVSRGTRSGTSLT